MGQALFNGTTDLGPTAEMFAAYAHFGRLSPGWEYDALHGSLHAVLAEQDDVHPDDLAKLQRQCAAFREEFGAQLSDHERWILGQLEKAASAR